MFSVRIRRVDERRTERETISVGTATHRAMGQFAGTAGASRQAAAATEEAAAPRTMQMTRSYPKVGRNDPCPCGSGKKYKYCHGQ